MIRSRPATWPPSPVEDAYGSRVVARSRPTVTAAPAAPHRRRGRHRHHRCGGARPAGAPQRHSKPGPTDRRPRAPCRRAGACRRHGGTTGRSAGSRASTPAGALLPTRRAAGTPHRRRPAAQAASAAGGAAVHRHPVRRGTRSPPRVAIAGSCPGSGTTHHGHDPGRVDGRLRDLAARPPAGRQRDTHRVRSGSRSPGRRDLPGTPRTASVAGRHGRAPAVHPLVPRTPQPDSPLRLRSRPVTGP